MVKEGIQIDELKIERMRNLQVAFNEEDFLLIFNSESPENLNGHAISIPIALMNKIVNGLYDSGLEYQRFYNKEIGFVER